jgi:hypothetical protein
MKFNFEQDLTDPPRARVPLPDQPPVSVLTASLGQSKARNRKEFEQKLKVKRSFEQENVAS